MSDRLNLRGIPEDLKNAALKEATKQGISLNAYIKVAIVEKLKGGK